MFENFVLFLLNSVDIRCAIRFAVNVAVLKILEYLMFVFNFNLIWL